MIRVKILKDNKHGKAGEIVVIDRNEGFGLIDSGQAILSKDMTSQDYKSKALDEEQANGKPQMRTVRKKF